MCDDLAKRVRLAVLQYRAAGGTYFRLSHFVWQLMPAPTAKAELSRRTLTSSAPKKLRGKVQAQLAKLAQQGIMYTRRGPEFHVLPFQHGEVDKVFSIRISIEQAVQLLTE